MFNNYFKSFILFFSLILFFNIIPQNSAQATEETSCTNTFYGVNGYASAVVQTAKVFNSLERSIAWGLKIDSADQSKFGSEVRVDLGSSRINLSAINPPYATHYEEPSYNFHGSLKKYQWKGQSGGGTLRYGDEVYLKFYLVSTDTGASDTVTISCTLD